jgi:hypothetical protein
VRKPTLVLLIAVGLLASVAHAADKKKDAAKPAKAPAAASSLEPKAVDLLKASSATLAAAKSMSFTAVVSYENPSLLGPPLVYTTKTAVLMQRPNKVRAITSGDGPASEFYYDGKTMTAFEPKSNLAATAKAPGTIEATLAAAYKDAAIYFPWTDVVVADPWADIAKDLKLAFYIGQSEIVGGTKTDMVAYANDLVFVQAWIGADDKLPRRLRAVYANDPSRLRHEMELSDWKLDVAVPDGAFASKQAASAKPIPFARPDPVAPAGIQPPPKSAPAKKK